VGDSLKGAGLGQVEHGSTLLPRKSKKCDWIWVNDNEVVLVEVKSVRFSFEASMTKQRSALKAQLSKTGGLADGLIQLNESARSIRAGATILPKRSYLSALMVVRGDQVGLNSPFVRDLLEEILRERGHLPIIVKYQLTNDLGFTYLVQLLASGVHLGKFLHKKMKHPMFLNDDMHFAVLREKSVLPKHPLVDEHWIMLDGVFHHYAPDIGAPSSTAEGERR
jgi:hypothetical protein